MTKLEEIQARREERAKAREADRLAQYSLDLEALDALEEEHGAGLVRAVELDPAMFFDGLPTMAILRLPDRAENKRYKDQIERAKQDQSKYVAAGHLLGHACVVYPPKEVYEKLLEKVDHFHARVSAVAIQLSQGGKDVEGKG